MSAAPPRETGADAGERKEWCAFHHSYHGLCGVPPAPVAERCAKCGDPASVGHEFGFRDHAFVCPKCGEEECEHSAPVADGVGPFDIYPEHAAIRPTVEVERPAKAVADGCWLWDGHITPNGYGRVYPKGGAIQAHRLVYETLVGPIPEGLQLDHLCRIPSCVNPKHLEPVTGAENRARTTSFANNAKKTACPQGHPYVTIHEKNRGPRRKCPICAAEHDRIRQLTRKRGKAKVKP